jgi:hypothetical protein
MILHCTGWGRKAVSQKFFVQSGGGCVGIKGEAEEMPIVYGYLSFHRFSTPLHTHMCRREMAKEREEQRSSWDYSIKQTLDQRRK